ncbi:MAG: hypothetical protein IIZ80_05805 [Erysipelotrichaceae bacterium]|nr:hypothetical protein [Erysipelotrichaceae bacterium]
MNKKLEKSQKLLKFFSIIQLLSALAFALLLILLLVAAKDDAVYETIKKNQTEMFLSVAKLLINMALLFVSYYILNRTSKDPSQHNSALLITLVVIAFEIFNFITSLGVGVPRNLVSMVVSVIVNIIIMLIIENVKLEYERLEREKRVGSL